MSVLSVVLLAIGLPICAWLYYLAWRIWRADPKAYKLLQQCQLGNEHALNRAENYDSGWIKHTMWVDKEGCVRFKRVPSQRFVMDVYAGQRLS